MPTLVQCLESLLRRALRPPVPPGDEAVLTSEPAGGGAEVGLVPHDDHGEDAPMTPLGSDVRAADPVADDHAPCPPVAPPPVERPWWEEEDDDDDPIWPPPR